MRFSNYIDFDDFCSKNNMTPVEGLKFLEKELLQAESRVKIG